MEERMMILKMLQEGKITADEANKLLEAIERGNSKTDTGRASSMKFDEVKFEEKMNKINEKASKFADKLGKNISSSSEKFGSNAERFAEDFSKKMESFGNDMAEAAVKFSDKLVNFLSNSFDIGYDKYQFTKTNTYPVEGIANISVKASNFAVKISPTEASEITANVYVNSSIPQLNIDEYFRADIKDSNYNFVTEFSGRTWGKIELLVPKNVGTIYINTTNGRCELSEISSDYISSHTSNGKIVLHKCSSKEIEAITNNGKVICEESTAGTANIGTSNGKIEITECKLDNVDAKTSNGSIQLSGIKQLDSAEGKYDLRTSNGKIYLSLSKCEGCGFMVDANTSLGSINIDLPDMTYMINKKTSTLNSSASVKSANYDSLESKIYIKANTSNASITIEGE